ncbi:MIF4G-like domain-containing protein [Chloropicon primus]|uniref:MIF4G-like type 1 domain-containing protein n=2 Tax=Chloropicon primus TaxID=1764295 RepID=A0A5B8MQ61_9CHLO|nr:hypothetical protein A3770_05p39600 [Chloropicon primus]UPR00654.1 MIF4G-like domain-containing protein [Chloropicon primus]|eukprot:QDZ21442.1 hypothetical protein A3770_05p39600 [Chloropicon primus]
MKRGREPIRYGGYYDEVRVIHELLDLPESPESSEERSDEDAVSVVAHQLVGKLPHHQYGVQQVVVDMALSHPTKHDVLAYLLSLMCRKGNYGRDLCKGVLSEVVRTTGSSIKSGLPVHAKIGLRFLACCSAADVLEPKTAASIMNMTVESATKAREKSKTQDKLANYAFYGEYLVYCVLCALPLAAESLQRTEKEMLASLLEKLGAYIAGRPKMKNDSLCLYKGEGYPTLANVGVGGCGAGVAGQVDWIWAAYQSDGAHSPDFDWSKVETINHFEPAGAASAAAEAKQDGVEMVVDGNGKAEGPAEGGDEVMNDSTTKNESGKEGLKSITEEELIPPRHQKSGETVPSFYFSQETVEKVDRFTEVVAPYCSFLPKQHTRLGDHDLNQVLIHELAADSLTSLATSPQNLGKILVSLPAGGLQYTAVLAEAVFSDMLQLPSQHFAPIFYSGVISDLCLKMPGFPKYMSACVRYALERVDSMDLEASQRLAQWQAYHLSAFQFQWPWERWGWTDFPQRGESDRRRVYIKDCFVSLQRLAYHEHITKKVPPELHPLVEAGRVEPNKRAEGDEGEKKIDMMSSLIFKKRSAEDFLLYLEGANETPKHVVMAILCIGGKSFTHMRTLLKRYRAVIDRYAKDKPLDILDILFTTWSKFPDKFMMAFTCLLEEGILNDVEALEWSAKDHLGGEPGSLALLTSRARIHWAVVESSLAACCNVASDRASGEETRRTYEGGIKLFWSRVMGSLGKGRGGEGGWSSFALQHLQCLARRHAKVLKPLIAAGDGGDDDAVSACQDEGARRAVQAGLDCFSFA